MVRRGLAVVCRGSTLAVALLTALAGCAIDRSGTGPASDDESQDSSAPDATRIEASTPGDAAPDSGAGLHDATVADAAPDVGIPCDGLLCKGACLQASDCSSCPGAPLLCASSKQCLAACDSCNGDAGPSPIECFACDATHQNPKGSCEPDNGNAYCLGGNYFAAPSGAGYRCACDADAAACPGNSQMCVPLGSGSFCVTCGEPVPSASSAAPCRGGGTCAAAQHACVSTGDP